MSADASAANLVPAQATAQEPAAAAEPAEAALSGPLLGDPMMLGLPCFIAGSVSLGLALVGVVPAAAVGAALPIILTATSIGLFLATIWSASLGQTAVASVSMTITTSQATRNSSWVACTDAGAMPNQLCVSPRTSTA